MADTKISALSAAAAALAAMELGVNDAGASKKLTVLQLLTLFLASTEQLLAEVTLGSNGTSLASGTIPARTLLRVELFIEGYSSGDTASLQFNATGGTAYRYRWLTSAAGATTFAAGLLAASTDRIKIAAADVTTSRRVTCHISNDASVTEKLVKMTQVHGTGSAATQAPITLGNGAWISGASTQITAVALISTQNMLAGTKMAIYGSPT